MQVGQFHSTPRPMYPDRTSGAGAAGAARAAFEALVRGVFPDPVPVALPKGLRPEFALATCEIGGGSASAAIVKNAGDDPDVTHGALIVATVRRTPTGAGVSFRAGAGVGTVTLPGLPLPPGEPAITPAPREMIRAKIGEVAAHYAVGADAEVEISVPGGEKIAWRTLASFSRAGDSGIFPVLSQAAISLGCTMKRSCPAVWRMWTRLGDMTVSWRPTKSRILAVTNAFARPAIAVSMTRPSSKSKRGGRAARSYGS